MENRWKQLQRNARISHLFHSNNELFSVTMKSYWKPSWWVGVWFIMATASDRKSYYMETSEDRRGNNSLFPLPQKWDHPLQHHQLWTRPWSLQKSYWRHRALAAWNLGGFAGVEEVVSGMVFGGRGGFKRKKELELCKPSKPFQNSDPFGEELYIPQA